MILDTLKNASCYYGLHPRFADAFAFLSSTDLSTLAEGRNEIDGENMFVMLLSAEGSGHGAGPLEVHRDYIDIHFTLEGIDEISWKPLENCAQIQVDYQKDDDYALFDDSPNFYSVLPAGTFGIFFPQDAHGTMVGYGEVKKLVIKILI